MKLLSLFFVLLLLPQVTAVGIGVNRASLEFIDVLPGGFARAELYVTTDSDIPITGEVLLREGDESKEWLIVPEGEFTFSRDIPYRLVVDFQPPSDARIDSYNVDMSVLTGKLSFSQEGQMGTATRASLGVKLHSSITGTERRACRVAVAKILDAEREQPVELQVSVLNTGNVRISPDVTIEFYDKYRSTQLGSLTESFDSVILPTLMGEANLFYDIELPRDQYWATIRIPDCGYSNVFTFDVLEAGEVKDEGEFIRIDAQPWAKVGDIVPIKAIFRNKGSRSLRANFRGTIVDSRDGQIVKVINTDTYIVDPDVTAEIETFFNPQQQGHYTVTGKVFYNDKLTRELSAILNITGSAMALGNPVIKYSLYALLFVALFFVFLILQRKRPKRRR